MRVPPVFAFAASHSSSAKNLGTDNLTYPSSGGRIYNAVIDHGRLIRKRDRCSHSNLLIHRSPWEVKSRNTSLYLGGKKGRLIRRRLNLPQSKEASIDVVGAQIRTSANFQKCWCGFSKQALSPMHDICQWLSLVRNIQPTGFVALLTPFLGPARRDVDNAYDPLERFGQALANHHWNVRHVPYTNEDGITSIHLGG